MSVMSVASSAYKGVSGLPRKLFGTRNDRILKGYQRHVGPINEIEASLRGDFDERFAARVASDGVDSLPEEEREAARQAIRVELSGDLLERSASLRERVREHYGELVGWWESLDPSTRLEEHYKDEYRKRTAKVIEAMDRAGTTFEAFAVLREASRRSQRHRHFDSQLIGGRVLFEGKIAEMRTGEGKTIVCHLAAFVTVLSSRKVHVVTVNDYLVRRDAEFAAPIFELVGMTVGCIQSQVDPGGGEGIRRAAYGCDITYGTNSEFGFDYLRDNMKTRYEDQVQGALDFVIVDEVDSILIDEARTPLIISGHARDDVTRYPRANRVAEELVRRQVPWDRKLAATVSKYDGNAHDIPKLDDAMTILGHREQSHTDAKSSGNDDKETLATLGPDFLTDDHVEAIQIYEADVLNLSGSERYRRYYIVQLERKQVGITHEGVTIAQELLDLGSLYSGANMEWPHLIENALRAHKVYQCDRDYVVQEGQVIIVDPFTGRLMHGRQWSDGLHQAVEAKENVKVKEETQTLATITIQNFVKLYRVKAGMTGTALTEATEFDKIYKLDVVEIPTNRPVNRVDHNDKMYRDVEQKYNAIVDEIFEVHRKGVPADPFLLADAFTAMIPMLKKQGADASRVEEALKRFNKAELGDKDTIAFMMEVYDEVMGDLVRGRPILVGTTSVENSEKISRLLDQRYGIEHEVLNAKNHAREADIVMKAGETTLPTSGRDKTPRGNVTIATNMAGRGTDIKLGLNVVYPTCKVPEKLPEGAESSSLYPTGITKCCVTCDEYDAATNCAHCFKPKLDPRFPELGRKICSINVPCGLHIIGTERHESRRIDNQLRGRSGRQGDPGSSRFSLSLQDDLLKMFMSDWMLKMMEKLGFSDGSSLEDKRLSKGIERAQRKVEERNFSTRKHLLEWDEPMDFQRKEFYAVRQRILEERDLPALIFETIDNAIRSTLDDNLSPGFAQSCIAEWCRTNLELTIEDDAISIDDLESAQHSIRRKAKDEAEETIRTSIGEYIDPDEPSKSWDIGGLLTWAKRMFNVPFSQNHLRKMEPREIEDAIIEAANDHYDKLDLGGIALYLDAKYPHQALVDWAKAKFDIEVGVEEALEMSKTDIEKLLHDRVSQAYRSREMRYPVEWCVERAFADEAEDNATAANTIVAWTNSKFGVGWTLDDVQGHDASEIIDKLFELNESFFNGKLEEEIDAGLSGKTPEEAVNWAHERFGRAWNPQRFEEAVNGRLDGDYRAAIVEQGREMLRWELTRLEQYVLLRIYDQAWKDHLLEMDHLKTAIMQRPLGGDQSHPQSQFAIEGRQLFRQMWARIAGRVTDIIFKIRGATLDDGGHQRKIAMSMSHADSTGAGFAGGASADQEAAMKAQGSEQKVETIRRDQPKVGRNDPCPCGSGKKYKQCHGKN